MIWTNQIGWARAAAMGVGNTEGPVFYGRNRYVPSADATFDEKIFAVVSQTEGALDSINMWDRAVISVGAIQWAGFVNVSNLTGFVADQCGNDVVAQALGPAMTMARASFRKDSAGTWRFRVIDTTGAEHVVNDDASARALFLHCSGRQGAWDGVSMAWAKTWCAAYATLFQDPGACQAQVDYTIPRLRSFVLGAGQRVLLAPGTPEEGMGGALKALHISYCINLPAVAERVLIAALSRTTFPPWSDQWCLDIAHDLALTSGVSIWPGRYDAVRPVIERLFNVELPKTSGQLAQRSWANEPVVAAPPIVPPPPPDRPVDSGDLGQAASGEFPVVSPPPLPPSSSVFSTIYSIVKMILGFVGIKLP